MALAPAPAGTGRVYPAAVERWRPLLEAYLSDPALVDKALWVIMHESGGDPNNPGDGGRARGLFQIQDKTAFANRPDAAWLDDPANNIRYAIEQLGIGQGNFSAWGENNTDNGKKFGALGNNPYPGYGDQHTGMTLRGAEPGDNTPTPTTGTQSPAEYLSQVRLALLMDPPKRNASDPRVAAALSALKKGGGDPNNPADMQAAFDAAYQAWQTDLADAETSLMTQQKFDAGLVTVSDGRGGTVNIALAGASPAIQAAAKASVENNWRAAQNKYAMDQYDLSKDAELAKFNARISKVTAQTAIDNLNLSTATSKIARDLQGMTESRQRAQYVTESLLKAAPWATTGGKTSFSANDVGAGALASLVGINPNDTVMRYTGTTHIDPAGLMAAYDAKMGVGQGPLASIPEPTVNAGMLPGDPNLPAPPSLLGPSAMPTQGAPATTAAAMPTATKVNGTGDPEIDKLNAALAGLTAGAQQGEPTPSLIKNSVVSPEAMARWRDSVNAANQGGFEDPLHIWDAMNATKDAAGWFGKVLAAPYRRNSARSFRSLVGQ